MNKKALLIIGGILAIITISFIVTALANNKLEKIVFIHYKKGYGKVATPSQKSLTCYTFITPTKVRWKNLPVNYIINPRNPVQNLDENLVISAVVNAAEEWDNYTSKELMNNNYTIDYSLSAGTQDYKNVISFGNYSDPNVIAVTTVWYNPATKEIVEFDIMLDVDWNWGDAVLQCNSNETFTNSSCKVMDLQNILTHEFGHGIGLGDVYDSACSEVTMYGYSDYGEVKKRTLEQPDITGLQTLYGA
jgi:hypothetical protein